MRALSVFFFCLFLLPSSCARVQWGEVLEGEADRTYRQAFDRIKYHQENCTASLDGEMVLNIRSHLENKALSGFLQFMSPAYIRFTVYTPLGQPLWATTADGSAFQVLDVSNRVFSYGSIRSYGIRHDIPPPFLSGPWFSWLTGRISSGRPETVLDVRRDKDGRGVWFTVLGSNGGSEKSERLLIDVERELLLERIINGGQDDPLATISYESWQPTANCMQPMNISVTGLSFGTAALISLDDVKPASLGSTDFNLPIPPGYTRRFMP